MRFFPALPLLSLLRFTLSSENLGVYQSVPSNLTRKECLSLREIQEFPNRKTMFCIAKAVANSALKAFYPVENKCDSNLNISPTGNPCYSVRAWSEYGKDSIAKEHQHSQSLYLSLYYGLAGSVRPSDLENMKSIELTMENPLNCSAIYKPSRRLHHGISSGSYSVDDVKMDSTTSAPSVSVSLGYKTPLKGIIGGFSIDGSFDYTWINSRGEGKGTSMTIENPHNSVCEPYLYQSALICQRQSGKLKMYYKDGNSKEIQIKESNDWLLMPLDHTHSDFFNPIIACVDPK